jgi:choline-phosphate cytidylyltransferase
LGKFKATQRTKGISTTDVVAKILRNKEMYYVRNLRRGVPRQKLGMGIFRYIKLKVQLVLCPDRFNHPKKD